MIRVRAEQYVALESDIVSSLEAQLVRDISGLFPRQYRQMGEDIVRAVVSAGVVRARARHSMGSKKAIQVFVVLAFILGSGFDSDPQLAWAAEALSNDFTNEAGRTKLLYSRASVYLEKVLGFGAVKYANALRRIIRLEPVRLWDSACPWKYSSEFTNQLYELYPEKFANIDSTAILHLCDNGALRAARLKMFSQLDVAIYILFMFMLGSEFESDPRFPWISPLLSGCRPQLPTISKCAAAFDVARQHAWEWTSDVLA